MSSVLITGAGRGIGRATTERLAGAGWDVWAAVRSQAAIEDLEGLENKAIHPLILDVTDEAQIAALDDALPSDLDAVVNNAGIVVGGPVEAVPPADLRRQLEVNVVGQAAVTQAVLGRIRSSRGRIVFVSSVSGFIATPMMGAYSASKFALEALADSLRMEVAPWGVGVSVVQPAQTDTDLWRSADQELDETVATLTPEHRTLYARHLEGFRKSIPRSQKMAAPVDGVAKTIERALTEGRPKARYVVGRPARTQARIALLMPTSLRDRVLRGASGVPKSA